MTALAIPSRRDRPMFPLFAQGGDPSITASTIGTYAGVGSLLTALGVFGKWAWDEWRKYRTEKDKKQADEREAAEKKAEAKEATYITQLENANARLAKEKDDFVRDAKEQRVECDQKDQVIADLRVYQANQSGYTKYLQSVLKAHDIPFDVWNGAGPTRPEAKP